jgi:branched-chain amino acid transport system ATP-binding protein
MLTVSDLRAGYGTRPVLHGVSLHVAKGEFVAMLGPNGAGKTTLMHAVSGLMRSWDGQIAFDGVDVTAAPSHERVEMGICLVPEGRQIFPSMTVAENLWLGGYPRRARARRDEREAEMYDLFPRLAERREQRAGTLSGGEQQMLALARCLMAGPELLLLDEPSLGLAPIAIDHVFEPLQALRGTLTILLVEQDAGRALDLCDRAYVLEEGEINLEGPASSLARNSRLIDAYLGVGT